MFGWNFAVVGSVGQGRKPVVAFVDEIRPVDTCTKGVCSIVATTCCAVYAWWAATVYPTQQQ